MSAGGHAGEEPSVDTVAASGTVDSEVVRRRYFNRGTDMGKMIFFPKGKGGYQWIGLLEVAWKVCAPVVYCQINRSVELHDALHGFRADWVKGMATLE